MKRLISIEKERSGFSACIETSTTYRFFDLKMKKVLWGKEYTKAEYRGYEHFVGVMSKFDPYTFFLKKPIEVQTIDSEALEKVWQRVKK